MGTKLNFYFYKKDDKKKPVESSYGWFKGYKNKYFITKGGGVIEELSGLGKAMARLEELRKDEVQER